MTLAEAKKNIGERIMYIPTNGSRSQMEFGVISFVNDTYVFVKYETDLISKATNPENITLLSD